MIRFEIFGFKLNLLKLESNFAFSHGENEGGHNFSMCRASSGAFAWWSFGACPHHLNSLEVIPRFFRRFFRCFVIYNLYSPETEIINKELRYHRQDDTADNHGVIAVSLRYPRKSRRRLPPNQTGRPGIGYVRLVWLDVGDWAPSPPMIAGFVLGVRCGSRNLPGEFGTSCRADTDAVLLN